MSADARSFEPLGYTVVPGLVGNDLVERATRRLNLEIVRLGLAPDEIRASSETTFFPHLRWHNDILALRQPIEDAFSPAAQDIWADPQLLLRFPDEADEGPLTPHVDGLPQWANSRRYRFIAGVALSRSHVTDGCLAVWPGSHRGATGIPRAVELDPGDVVVMHPQLRHSSTLNRGPWIRYVVYFRLLAEPHRARMTGRGSFCPMPCSSQPTAGLAGSGPPIETVASDSAGSVSEVS